MPRDISYGGISYVEVVRFNGLVIVMIDAHRWWPGFKQLMHDKCHRINLIFSMIVENNLYELITTVFL